MLKVAFVAIEKENGFRLGDLDRLTMVISGGDPTIFVTRPISLGLLLATLGLVLLIVVPRFRKTREAAFQED